jgi:hypothetical protein
MFVPERDSRCGARLRPCRGRTILCRIELEAAQGAGAFDAAFESEFEGYPR